MTKPSCERCRRWVRCDETITGRCHREDEPLARAAFDVCWNFKERPAPGATRGDGGTGR